MSLSSTQAVQLPFGRSSPSFLYALAAAAGVGILGYTIYFDHKRRSQPDYKQKIRESKSWGNICFHFLFCLLFFINQTPNCRPQAEAGGQTPKPP